MKRKTTDENEEFEGKRGRSISNGSNGDGNHSAHTQVQCDHSASAIFSTSMVGTWTYV